MKVKTRLLVGLLALMMVLCTALPAFAADANGAASSTYTVVKGDSLWKIAKKLYGDGTKWSLIYEANKNSIKDPRLIWPGQVLVISSAPTGSTGSSGTTTTTPTTPAGGSTYIVVKGDSLWKIAKKLYGDGTKWGLIYEANKSTIKDPSKIWPGQVLIIGNATSGGTTGSTTTTPSTSQTGNTYTVVKGDSLWKIAKKLYGDGNKWGKIYEANKSTIKDPRVIVSGQVLIIPAA